MCNYLEITISKSNLHNYDNFIVSIYTIIMVVFQIEKFPIKKKIRKTMTK